MSIKIEGLEAVKTKLQKLQTKLSGNDMKKTLTKIGLKIQNSIEESFEDEKSPFGQKWKPLSKKTKKRKAKRGKSSKILREDGNLFTKATSNEVVISNNTSNGGFPYGLTHQFGTDNAFGKGIKVEARPFLPVDSNGELEKSLEENILNTLSNEIERVFK